jgi:hypothetical protein
LVLPAIADVVESLADPVVSSSDVAAVHPVSIFYSIKFFFSALYLSAM